MLLRIQRLALAAHDPGSSFPPDRLVTRRIYERCVVQTASGVVSTDAPGPDVAHPRFLQLPQVRPGPRSPVGTAAEALSPAQVEVISGIAAARPLVIRGSFSRVIRDPAWPRRSRAPANLPGALALLPLYTLFCSEGMGEAPQFGQLSESPLHSVSSQAVLSVIIIAIIIGVAVPDPA